MNEWAKGHHADHDVVVIEVLVRRDQHGRVLSEHRLQDDGDRQVVDTWPSGGMEQVAFALLTEAVRREALLDVILKATHQPEIREIWTNASEEMKGQLTHELTRAVQESMSGVISRLAGSASRTALDLISTPPST